LVKGREQGGPKKGVKEVFGRGGGIKGRNTWRANWGGPTNSEIRKGLQKKGAKERLDEVESVRVQCTEKKKR